MTKKIIIIVAAVLIIAVLYYVFNLNRSMDNSMPPVTQEELADGFYWGEIKRPGTPDTWVLVNAGTRGAKWTDPKNSQK